MIMPLTDGLWEREKEEKNQRERGFFKYVIMEMHFCFLD